MVFFKIKFSSYVFVFLILIYGGEHINIYWYFVITNTTVCWPFKIFYADYINNHLLQYGSFGITKTLICDKRNYSRPSYIIYLL